MVRKQILFLPSILVALGLLVWSGVGSGIGYPAMLALRGGHVPQAPVVLVTIDASAEDAFGPWPWPVTRLAEVVRVVRAMGARVLVLDSSVASLPFEGGVHWAFPPGLKVVAPVHPTSSGFPASACRLPRAGAIAGARELARVPGLTIAAGVPCDPQVTWGVQTAAHLDARLRWPLAVSDGSHVHPTLDVVAVLVAEGHLDRMHGDWWRDASHSLDLGVGEIRTNRRGEVLRDLHGPAGTFPQVSARDLLEGRAMSSGFRDAIVVLGLTSPGRAAFLPIPFEEAVLGPRMAQAEVLASGIATLLDQTHVRSTLASVWLPPGFLLLVGAVVGVFLSQRRRWPALVLLVGLSVAGGAISWMALNTIRLWIEPLPLVFIPLLFVAPLMMWPRPPRLASPVQSSGMFRRTSDTSSKLAVRPTASLRPSSSVLSVEEPTSAFEAVTTAQGDRNTVQVGPDGHYLRIGRYTGFKPLGKGGMGAVYDAWDPVMDRRVAIKILRSDRSHSATTEQRFLREAKVAGALHHPSITTVYDFGQAGEVLYMVMEFIQGITLSQWIREHLAPSPLRILPWIRQMGDALDSAHRQQVVHRDVKPSNFMIQEGTGLLKLMDFGVARTPDASLTQAGTTVGTPNYMAPEQLQGSKVGPASDQYSMGVVVYQLLTQKVPFLGNGLTELCGNILAGRAIPLSQLRPDLSPSVCAEVHRAFAPRVEERFPSCTAFVQGFAREIGA